jgi:hypothetical protein
MSILFFKEPEHKEAGMKCNNRNSRGGSNGGGVKREFVMRSYKLPSLLVALKMESFMCKE